MYYWILSWAVFFCAVFLMIADYESGNTVMVLLDIFIAVSALQYIFSEAD